VSDTTHDPQKIIATVCDEWDRGDLADYPSVEIGRRLNAAGWHIVRASAIDAELDDDPDSPTYDQLVPVWTIAEEWSP
jgi:hypothetical protein